MLLILSVCVSGLSQHAERLRRFVTCGLPGCATLSKKFLEERYGT
jgi:hypothetical protein